MSEQDRLQRELERAYRALRGIYGKIANGEKPDETMLAYHGATLGAAVRYVAEGSLEGSEYFEGKSIEVLHDTLRSAIR